MGTLQAQLDYLYDLKAALSVIEMYKQAVIDTVLTPEIREKLAEIDTEFSFQKKAVQDSIDQAEIEIKVFRKTGDPSISIRTIQ